MNESVELRRMLDRVAVRFQRARLWGGLAACWLVLAAAAGLAVALRPSIGWNGPLAVAGLALAAWAGCSLLARRAARDPRWVARRIEATHSELSALLVTAVEQQPPPGGRLGFLQAAVVRKALDHRRSHDWEASTLGGRAAAARAAHWAAFAVLMVAFVAMIGRAQSRPTSDIDGIATTVIPTGVAVEVKVDPGNAEIERGTPLLVTATFPGFVPPEAALAVADSPTAFPLSRNLDDPTFAGTIPAVEADLSYRVEFPGGSSEAFQVKVFDYPRVNRVNARLAFPPYTGMEPKTVENVRHVTAVEGTEVTLFFQLNKPVGRAALIDEKGGELPLAVHDPATHTYRTTLTANEPKKLRAQLIDPENRRNKLPTEITVNVTRNQPPTVAVSRPGRDSRVSPLEELPLKADLKDDFGLVRYGVSVAPAGQPPREIALQDAAPVPAVKKAQPDYLLDLEALHAQPDDVVAYFFWAEDIGPDGKPRRTSGDMYFAEVRHFEEIFRQGQPPPGGAGEQEQQGGGNAQQAGQLAELQKQILNGTWKLIRREVGPTPTDKLGGDAAVLRDSQRAALEQAAELGERLTDPASAESLKRAVGHMTEAEKQLGETADKKSIPTLQPALAAAQSAYQALMKLRAREFEVTRNNRQQQNARGSSGANPSQNQLNQLDLADDEDRYETQSAARDRQQQQAQRDREQRENGEIANRLQELARRQTDLNERLKELQSALEQATDDQQREELQRQLKRLRDQQEQVLRDTDELRERLESEQNRERLADAREQIEQTRERVRQASEALEEGRLSQAVTEGTRAERQLNQLRDDLRKESANRFGDEMRDLREQARKLDEDQKQLTRQLDEMKGNPSRSLRDSGERGQVKQGLEQQRTRLDRITDRMRQTVQEAEQPEPRLAQELFDTVRNAAEQRIGDNLTLAERLAELGGVEQAADAARRSGQGIEQLRQGVERAAESVLGGQTEALKRAQRELEELSDQLNREIAQATGDDRQPGQRGQPGQQGERQGQQGQQGEQQGQGQREGQQGEQQGQQGQRERQQGQQGQQGQGGQRGQQGQQGQQGQGGQQGEREGQPGAGGQQGEPGQRGQQPGQRGQGGAPTRQTLTGRQPGGEPNPDGQPGGGRQQAGGAERLRDGPGGGPGGPIRGDGYREWSDRLRGVEDLIDDPQLRAEAGRIRDRARGFREEARRHAKDPDWNKLRDLVSNPLNELRNRVAEEVRKRESPDALVPIDRDPVPPEFTDGVRRYYERLGSDR